MKEISVEQLLALKNAVPIDVRSPGEYDEFKIPGAVNVPLFTNEERAMIGTIYKQEGSDMAKWRAMEVVSPKLPSILGQIKGIREEGKHPVIYCWRGGMRSQSVATFLSFAGISIHRLAGGYRAYRQFILEEIPGLIPSRAISIHGMTGVGKTEVLEKLKEKGMPVINLEALARHRGSIFGSFGLFEGHNQKTFDSLLFQTLWEVKDSPFFLVEAESKRIGKVVQPDELLAIKHQGFNINLQASLSSRIERIYREYVEPYQHEQWFHDKVMERLKYIFKRIKDSDIIAALNEAARNKNYKLIIQVLLEEYYDPRYSHKQLDYVGAFHHIEAENTEKAVEEILKLLETKSALSK
ncbi:tRNA 2-selenouridine(34) synthase MnmH [Bacillus sp. DTU_2020_1000418_1_SI_GHA_SEK_038]|uniref:tRNA 2-selenouridine(34) synthase MnmH n=1 Tax=Bacillus sp. DTU_2020_1000418_1_SI_GHA_SEK_038 TaxID=3077585 RepID=UPI0028ED456D|nr:tRNA 2-selenouridine(34) synthase MnmH [Bacillus sp. DTU_2020_1000418_1_SI_GHA_SEK_038]WNS76391.1 tRNA 2-selenouridine(34) synthase MnmH [Bacillus sp. DTU_2020_1000418_1_SI_GHA_SEK_038]